MEIKHFIFLYIRQIAYIYDSLKANLKRLSVLFIVIGIILLSLGCPNFVKNNRQRIREMENTLNISRSLKTLKILVFWEVLETSNVLLIDNDFHEGKEYTAEQVKEIESIWTKLYDDYFRKKNSSRSKSELLRKNNALIDDAFLVAFDYTINALKWVAECYDVIPEEVIKNNLPKLYEAANNAISTMGSAKIIISEAKNPHENLAALEKFKQAFINKQTIKKTSQPNQQQPEEAMHDYFSDVAAVSQALEMQLNVKDMVVSEWLSYERMANEKAKAIEAGNKRANKKKGI